MDPFTQVYSDALGQLSTAEHLIETYDSAPQDFHVEDLNNVIQELVETIHDLSQSTGAIQSRPQDFGLTAADVHQRISQVGELNRQLMDLQEKMIEIRKKNAGSSGHLFSSSSVEKGKGVTRSSNFNNGYDGGDLEAGNGVGNANSSLLFQDEIQNQDNMLESVSKTVNNLNQQAHIMSQELAEQSVLIEDFDRQVDTAQDRLQRGMKRVNWIIRKNQETLGSCCITLLILVLIILLILLLVL